MNKKTLLPLTLLSLLLSCTPEENNAPIPEKTNTEITKNSIPMPTLNLAEANRLATLPFECMQVEYPNKLGQRLEDASHIQSPKALHPAFYGCFDWHSAVHGHWSLVSLLKQFPDLDHATEIRKRLSENINPKNIATEVAYFKMKGNSSFERTYGWAWLLKLSEELHTWNDPQARALELDLQPLVDIMIEGYLDFLPKLVYPIRVGEHTNTAFGLSFALDYAKTLKNEKLQSAIETAALRFYKNDKGCPLTWEPSGYDFLSPCLEEANLMSKILPKADYQKWLNNFLPQLSAANFALAPGRVSDRADGKLVHLDGLNFSRAWCLSNIAKTLPEYEHLHDIAAKHINHSLPSIVDDHYSGTHWLGSFAIYAMNEGKG